MPASIQKHRQNTGVMLTHCRASKACSCSVKCIVLGYPVQLHCLQGGAAHQWHKGERKTGSINLADEKAEQEGLNDPPFSGLEGGPLTTTHPGDCIPDGMLMLLHPVCTMATAGAKGLRICEEQPLEGQRGLKVRSAISAVISDFGSVALGPQSKTQWGLSRIWVSHSPRFFYSPKWLSNGSQTFLNGQTLTPAK
eukprot:scaffold232100_cov24-Tisochrysis_lutea.AAC.1